MKEKSRKYNSFTLVELLLVTIIIGIVVPIIVEIYTFFLKSNKEIVARETVIQQGYEFFERLNILMEDYTVDYEEYFNRQMVGCVAGGGTGSNFTWNIGITGHCTEFTAYGNQNSTKKSTDVVNKLSEDYHNIYYCSSSLVRKKDDRACPNLVVSNEECGKLGIKQSFGQYKALFTNVKTGFTAACMVGTEDVDLGKINNSENIDAIRDSDNIQELYLISHDGKSRLYFRRKLVEKSQDYAQYRIQMLRLRGFDAGQEHNFDKSSVGLYDGQIDTWACDASMGFVCSGDSVSGAYSEYKLPNGVDDGWIDLTYGNTNIYARNISIFPLGDPELFWVDTERQINPYMKILLVNGVYLPEYANKNFGNNSIMDFKVPIETTINMKDFYRE